MAIENVQMKVSGLMCSFCTMSVEKALKRYPGVKSVLVNLVHGIVLVEADTDRISRDDLAMAVRKLGYDVSATEARQYQTDEILFNVIKTRGRIGLALAIAALLVDPLDFFALPEAARAWFSFAVALVVLVWVGQPILRKTALAVRQRVINANVLLSTAAWGSFVVGTVSLLDPGWPNFLPVASWLMALHLFFGFFKLDTRRKASEAVRKLLALQPSRARLVRGDSLVETATSEVGAGEITVVRPGERIPLDGEVVAGMASVDESSFTGESAPVTKEPGAAVMGGTLNLDGALKVKVTRTGQESFLSQIVRLMTQIAERKPPIELLADRLMNFYGPVVFAAAGLAFAGWLIFSGDWIAATLVLLTVIIMGYPCALGISTPMLAAIAGGKGISIGLLVKAGEVFHELSITDTVAFDKTGTLTYGRPTVTDVVAFGRSGQELLSLAGSLEEESEHPLARAISFYAQREGAALDSVEEFRAVPGQGVAGIWKGGSAVVGKPSFVEERQIFLDAATRKVIDELASQGKTAVVAAHEGAIAGVIGLQDTPRASAKSLMQRLKEKGIRTAMLTGDSSAVAQAIGMELGLDEIHAELLPGQKVEAVERLQKAGRKVAMVGDGINDAPALAQANVGIAIGAGTDVAIESAGVILIGDKLDDVANALELGKASYRTLKTNVGVAVAFNIGGMTLAAFGWITPLLAIGIMILSIFTILMSTLRIRALRFARAEEVSPVALAELEFSVPNMVCEGCAEKITAALQPLKGIREVRPKVARKHVYVRYEPALLTEQAVQQALAREGFTAIKT